MEAKFCKFTWLTILQIFVDIEKNIIPTLHVNKKVIVLIFLFPGFLISKKGKADRVEQTKQSGLMSDHNS